MRVAGAAEVGNLTAFLSWENGMTLEERMRHCEQENLRLRRQLTVQNRLGMAGILLLAASGALAGISVKDAVFDRVTAKEVVVVDANGKVRARLGGDLPDAVMAGGHVAKRGSKAAGLLIYDEEGIERGGYVTQDSGSNAMLTLDSKYHQSALFVAGPRDGQTSALRLWSPGSAIELRTDGNGARMSVSDQSGVTLQQPVVGMTADTCASQRQLEQEHPGKRICQGRYTESACQACLEH